MLFNREPYLKAVCANRYPDRPPAKKQRHRRNQARPGLFGPIPGQLRGYATPPFTRPGTIRRVDCDTFFPEHLKHLRPFLLRVKTAKDLNRRLTAPQMKAYLRAIREYKLYPVKRRILITSPFMVADTGKNLSPHTIQQFHLQKIKIHALPYTAPRCIQLVFLQ